MKNLDAYLKRPVPVHIYESLESTNDTAREMASAGAVSGTVVIAGHQTKGRGRLGRTFASPDNGGIYMSIVLRPENQDPLFITTGAAVAVTGAIRAVTGREASIKWVNDIYLDGRKVCGILAEAITDHTSGSIEAVILGIGINCSREGLPEELDQIAGAIEGDFSREQLAAEVINRIVEPADPGQVIREYKEASMVLGKTVSVYKGGFSEDKTGQAARVLDIDSRGGLEVIYSDGTRETLTSGEISIRF